MVAHTQKNRWHAVDVAAAQEGPRTMTIAAILKHKGCDIYSVRPSSTIAEIAQLLASRRIGAVMVTNSTGQLVGIVSERDIAYSLAVDGEQTPRKTAEQLMTHAVKTATLQTTTDEAMAIMTSGQFRHLPVLDRGALIGMVSIGDVVKSKLMQHETAVQTLSSYISGAGYSASSDLVAA